MGNMTLAIPDEVQKEMKKFPEIRWSEVARRAIVERIKVLETIERANKLASKSKLTKEFTEKLSKEIKRKAAERFFNDKNNS